MNHASGKNNVAAVAAWLLGTNVWLLSLVVPLHHMGSSRPDSGWILAGLAIATLLAGLAARSNVLLLLLFPLTLSVATLVLNQLSSQSLVTPLRFGLIAASFLGFFVASAWFLGPRGASPGVVSPLSPDPSEQKKWKRRLRLARTYNLFSWLIMAAVLGAILFLPKVQSSIYEMYSGRSAQMRGLFVIATLALWFLLYSRVFLQLMLDQRRQRRRLSVALGSMASSNRWLWLTFRLGLAAGLFGFLIWVKG